MELSKISQKCPLYESNGNTVPKVCTVLYSMHWSRVGIFEEKDRPPSIWEHLKKNFLTFLELLWVGPF
jgi:hypothetical protein